MEKKEFIKKEQRAFSEQMDPEDEFQREETSLDTIAQGLVPKDFAKRYKKMLALKAELEKEEKEFKDKLAEMWGSLTDAPNSVVLDGLKFTYVRPSKRKSFDSKKFQEDHPEMYDKYIKESDVKASIRTSVEY